MKDPNFFVEPHVLIFYDKTLKQKGGKEGGDSGIKLDFSHCF